MPPDGFVRASWIPVLGFAMRFRIRGNAFLRFRLGQKGGSEREVFPATGSFFIYQFPPRGMVELASDPDASLDVILYY
jgi:hypothetical protein